MADVKTAPYGSWKSPITSDLIVGGFVGLGGITLKGADIYWLEMRPVERGRFVLVRRTPDGNTSEVVPAPFNVRTTVHEYGGAAYVVDEHAVYFSNFADQRVYELQFGGWPQPITPAVDLRYADFVIDRKRNRLICVREDHTGLGEAVNTLVALPLDGKSNGGEVLVSGSNFYSNPRLSPDGTRLAWMSWNHPNMPWDGAELYVANIRPDGTLAPRRRVAGAVDESIWQPEWSPLGELYFVSDRTGWWNLYRWRDGEVQPLRPMAAEFGDAQWSFGMSTYAFESARHLICTYSENGVSHLASLDTMTLGLTELPLPYEDIDTVHAVDDHVFMLAGSPTEPRSVIRYDLEKRQYQVLKRSTDIQVDPGYVSIPETLEFPTENGLTAYAFYYPPTNKDYEAPAGEKPPLIVMSHGGPTGSTGAVLSLNKQYWTSRGFAVVDVNYGGSTGYGRDYRRRLNGQWGVVDMDDCVNAARYLAAQGAVDPSRMTITGGSAGGYTTLCAITFRDVFKAGASHFGIGDLEIFVRDTHKFESRYLDSLVGSFPEKQEVYRARSPILHLDQLNCALILFQGLEDKIVPPNQAQLMFDAVKKKGLPVAYVPFEGEQHGFRQAKNIKRALDGELYFYSRVFGFDLADPVEPVQIENL
ncbi:MAG: prolyl oligopeptidase family serine peptidase [Anaerolineae bacterium]